MIKIKEIELPLCAVRGMIQPGAMCGKVIVGMKYCGHAGECKHKRDATPSTPVATIKEQ